MKRKKNERKKRGKLTWDVLEEQNRKKSIIKETRNYTKKIYI